MKRSNLSPLAVPALLLSLGLSLGLTRAAVAQSSSMPRPRPAPADVSGAASNEAGEKKEEIVLHSNGTARVYRTPDFLDVHLGVVYAEKTAGEAQERAGRAMEGAIAAVKELGLAGLELQSGTVRLEPQYEDRSGVPYEMRPIVGYVASMTVRVRTDDVKAAAKILDAGLAAGANRVEGVEFGIHEAIEAREEAIRLAAKAAKRKVRVIAESLDLELGSVKNASSQSGMYGMWRGSHSNVMAQMSSARESGGGGEDGGGVEPGKVEIYAEVSVTYSAREAR